MSETIQERLRSEVWADMDEMYLAWSEYAIPGTSFSMDEDILIPRLEAADHIDALTKENERLREADRLLRFFKDAFEKGTHEPLRIAYEASCNYIEDQAALQEQEGEN